MKEEKYDPEADVYLSESQKRVDIKEDFEVKSIGLESFPRISAALSEEEEEIFQNSLDILQKTSNEILQKLKEKCSDPETAIIFINDLNEALRGKDVG